MYPLRLLRDELVGVRLSPANQTIWNMGGELISERARLAINDALESFEFYETGVYNSIGAGVRVTVLPPSVEKIVSLTALDPVSNHIYPVYNYNFLPTTQTNILHVDAAPSGLGSNSYMQLVYQQRVTELPEDTWLTTELTVGNPLNVTSNCDVYSWRAPGYLEISDPADASSEIIKYESVAPATFTNITRQISGTTRDWPVGSRISPITLIPPEAKAAVLAMAEANMYSFWVAHRATYDKYVSIVGLQAVELADVVTLIRVQEQRAEARYRRIHKAPPPSVIRRK